MRDGDNLSGNRLMLVLLFLVSLVSVVAVIVAAVSLTSSGSDTPSINVNSLPGASSNAGSNSPIVINTGSGGSSSGSASGDRIFKIAYFKTRSGLTYLDDTGYMKGFVHDLINGVCEIGGMNCVTIWDEGENCWIPEPGEHGRGGPGLFNGWYDACSHRAPTVDRVQVFDFSLPYFETREYHFFVLKTNNDFHAGDITGKTIGFFDNRPAAAVKCVARHVEIKGSTLPDEQTRHYSLPEELMAVLRTGEVDAIFGHAGYFRNFAEELKIPNGPALACELAGSSMMTMKDNDFNSHWNRAFQKFKDSGKFKKMCAQAEIDHGHRGGLSTCVDSP